MPESAATAIVDVELSNPFPLAEPAPAASAHALLRLHGAPLTFATASVARGRLDDEALLQTVLASHAASLARPLVERAILCGTAPAWPDVRALLACRPAISSPRPEVTIGVRASGAPGALRACLASVDAQDYPVGDTAIARRDEDDARLLARCAGDIVVIVDDSVVLDRGWVSAAVRAFLGDPDVMLLTGLTLPRLAPPALRVDDALLRRRWTHGPGARVVATPPVVAFWRAALDGARTGVTAAMKHLLAAGQTALYEPSALAWHPTRLATDPFASPAPAARSTTRRLDLGDAPRCIADAGAWDRMRVDITWHGCDVGRVDIDHRGTIVSAFRLHDAIARELPLAALDTRLRIGRGGLVGILTAELASHLVALRASRPAVDSPPRVVTARPAAA